MSARLVLASMAVALSALSVGCASSPSSSDVADAGSDGSYANQPDADLDGTSPLDRAMPPDGDVDAPAPDDVGIPPVGGDGGDGGGLCADDAGIFHASPGTCNGATCAPGCACIVDNDRRDVACFCRGASNPARGLTCIMPTCGSIFCEALCPNPVAGNCLTPEGDASGADPGPLCADDGGVFPASPGTCQGESCAPGCACVGDGNGQATCLCIGPKNPAGACIAPTCGAIFCGLGCTCASPGSGTCTCR